MKIKAPSVQCSVANVLCFCKRKRNGIEGIKSLSDLTNDRDHESQKEKNMSIEFSTSHTYYHNKTI